MTNIVILTVGSCNSTVTVRMLAKLGWQVGDVDGEFAEHRTVHQLNTKVMNGGPFDVKAAAMMLELLPRPWVVKDPKFCETLAKWTPVLEPYRPLLLWLTKDPAYVRRSFLRRFRAEAHHVDRRMKLCAAYFDSWPWSKWRLDADQVCAAVSLFDVARSRKHAGCNNP